MIDRSGTITSGGTAQTIAAADSTRIGFLIQNVSDTDMYVNFGAVAVAGGTSLKLVSGAGYETPSTLAEKGAVSVIGATTGKAFTAKEW